MRATRAFVASLGASLSIIVAGSLALLTVSTVVAFQGWPGISSAARSPSSDMLVAAGSAPTSARSDGRDALVVPRRPVVKRAPKPQPERASGQVATIATAPPATPASTSLQTRPTPRPQATSAHSSPPVTTKTPAPRPVDAGGDPVRKVGESLGNTVVGAGETLGTVVSNVSPTLGKVVEDTSNFVAGVVAGTSEVVAKVVDTLIRPPQPQQ